MARLLYALYGGYYWVNFKSFDARYLAKQKNRQVPKRIIYGFSFVLYRRQLFFVSREKRTDRQISSEKNCTLRPWNVFVP